jgi:hypothetical protein
MPRLAACLATISLCCGSLAAAQTVVIDQESSLIRGGAVELDLGVVAWGPKWAWMSWKGTVEGGAADSRGTCSGRPKGAPAPTELQRTIRVEGARVIDRIALSTPQAQDYTMIAPTIDPGKQWTGSVRARQTDGTEVERTWPIGKDGLGDAVAEITFVPTVGQPVSVQLDPPLDAQSDGAIRLILAQRLEGTQPEAVELSVTLPEEPSF